MGQKKLSKKALTERNVAFMARCSRGELEGGEQMIGSHWLNSLPIEERTKIAWLVFKYDNWGDKTDLTGTKAAGIVNYDGHTIVWRIKQFDPLAGAVLTLGPPPLSLGLFIMHSAEF